MDTITEILSNVFVDKNHKKKQNATITNYPSDTQIDRVDANPQSQNKEIKQKINGDSSDDSDSANGKMTEYSNSSSDADEKEQVGLEEYDLDNIHSRNMIVISNQSYMLTSIIESIFKKLDTEKAIAILEKLDRDNFKKIILKNPDMKLNLLKMEKILPLAIKNNPNQRIIIDYDFITDEFLKLLTYESISYLVVCNRLTKGIHIVKSLLNDPIVFVRNNRTRETYDKIINMFDLDLTYKAYANCHCDFFVLEKGELYTWNYKVTK